jgi:hypothetical protein
MGKRLGEIGVEVARKMFPVVPVSGEFLRPHPATLAWWAARDACRTCRHHLMREDSGGLDSGGERCGRLYTRVGSAGVGRRVNPYCVDARGEGARCGPGAALREPVLLADATAPRVVCTFCLREGHRAHACPALRRVQKRSIGAAARAIDVLSKEVKSLERKLDSYVPADQASELRWRILELEESLRVEDGARAGALS